MDVLEIMKRKLEPLYPDLGRANFPIDAEAEHKRIVAQGAQQQPSQSPLASIGSLGGAVAARVGGPENAASAGPEYDTAGVTPMEPGTSGPIDPTKFPATPGDDPATPTAPGERQRTVPGQPVRADVPANVAMQQAEAQPPVLPEPPLTRRQQLEKEIAAIQGKDYSTTKIKNPDGSTTKVRGKDSDKNHNILDVLASIGLGALKGASSGGFAGMIGGAVAGGVSGAIDRNYDNKIMDEYKLGGLRGELGGIREQETADAKVAEQQGKAVNQQLEARDRQQKANKGIYDETYDTMAADGIDENEAQILTALRSRLGMIGEVKPGDNRERERLEINGEIWERPKKGGEWKKAALPADETKAPVDVTTPMTGKRVKVSATDAYKTESSQAEQNADRTFRAVIENTNNSIEVQKTNASALAKWHSDKIKRRVDMLQQAGKNMDQLGDAGKVVSDMQANQQKMQEAVNNQDMDEFAKLQAIHTGLLQKFDIEMKKSDTGVQILNALSNLDEPAPKMVSAGTVNAPQVGGKVVSRKDLEGVARQNNWSMKQAEAYAKKNQWTIR